MSDLNTSVVESDVNVETIDVSIVPDTADDRTVTPSGAADAKRTNRLVPYDKINVDKARNPRLPEEYAAKKIGWLSRNILLNGLLEDLVLSQREDGSLWLLKGHLRHAAIGILRNEGLEAGTPKAENPAIEKDADFMGQVQCKVYKGLSLRAELDLVMDHGTSTKLSNREVFLSLKIMVKSFFTVTEMALKIRKDRTATGQLVGLLRMPAVVEESFMDEDKNKLFTSDFIGKLNAARNEDDSDSKKATGKGLRPRTFGPKSEKMWEEFVSTGKKPGRVNGMKPEDLKTQSTVAEDDDLSDLLISIAENDQKGFEAAMIRLKIRLRPIHESVTGEAVTITEEGITHTVNA